MDYEQVILSFTDNDKEKVILIEGLRGDYPKLRILLSKYFETSPGKTGEKYAQRKEIMREVRKIVASKAA